MDPITIQYLIVGALFLVAVVFLVRRTTRSLKGDKGCSKGCGGCSFDEKQKRSILAGSKDNP